MCLLVTVAKERKNRHSAKWAVEVIIKKAMFSVIFTTGDQEDYGLFCASLQHIKNNIMKQYLLLAAIGCLLGGCATEKGEDTAPLKMIDAVDFSHVKIEDAFWSPRLEKHITTTLPVCIDQIENQTGRIRNFENAAKGEGEHSGIFFDDSDVYKALEGMAYTLINHPDPELEKKADEWIDKFAAAQQPDG